PAPPAMHRDTHALPRPVRRRVRKYGTDGDPLAWTMRQIPGGAKAVWRLLAVSSDPDAVRGVASYHRRATKACGDVAEDAQMAPREFVGLVCRVAYDYNIALGKAIAAVKYPEMMKASVKRA